MKLTSVAALSLLGMSVSGVAAYALAPLPQSSAERRVAPGPTRSAAAAGEAYRDEVEADVPVHYFRLGEDDPLLPAHDEVSTDQGSYRGELQPRAPSPFDDAAGSAMHFLAGTVEVPVPIVFRAAPLHGAAVPPAFSMEAWIKPLLIDGVHRGVVSIEGPAFLGHQGCRIYLFRTEDGPKANFGIVNGTAARDVALLFPEDGGYHHVIATFDGRTKECLYLDGEGQCSIGAPPAIDGDRTRAVIGGRAQGNEPFVGFIAEVAFYDRALSPLRVLAHARAGR